MRATETEAVHQLLRSVRVRSRENTTSLPKLVADGSYGIAIGLLRQEIDTFIRLVYLDAKDGATALQLITQFAAGRRWKISERKMVETATRHYFWVGITYDFGCKLIHLSEFYDYESVDPFTIISSRDRVTIIRFLRSYHGYSDPDIDLPRFLEVLPKIMAKIAEKVEHYSSKIERRFS